MSGYYRVELQGMGRLAKDLESSAGNMRGAMRPLKDSASQSVGHEELQKACENFQSAWDYGVGQIADATDGITEGLRTSSRLYQSLEESVAELFTGGKTAK
ncbi:WXG100 family type VII secretion target [Streptomyces benahoarensis]|uniref:Excreted virulence factor EspC, type VII ESX diderm n=1 Tax=Streptomyces benahoarensis TaxID=2595054 RepID=A0A553ZLA0_9ACTN|nr:type VII secretion target [Streptomyces benahoarensis]TSB22436.1 hypothetical protein FNJ62_16315 [Streptomyces benahoarensis]TSB42207.1 hypothetical protein FNZ23_11065 [Streptomyces benahoarensis]